MLAKKLSPFLILAMMTLMGICKNNNAQIDSAKVAKTLDNIGDSLFVADSIKVKVPPKPFLIKFKNKFENKELSTFQISKKEIDFSDFRYSGNTLSLLPFGYLGDFGSLGSPSEPNLFGLGYGNISLSLDENNFENRWNSSVEMNKIQTESISEFKMVPINRSFLGGFSNNISSIHLKTSDTLKSKPLSRIRYYQSPNEEGFVDAFFSARILSKLSLSLRVTNNSIDENYSNTEYGSWKANVKGIYKVSDSLFTSFNYYHAKLNTPLNGGINIQSLTPNTSGLYDIYSTEFPVINSDMSNKTSINNITAKFYGKIFRSGTTYLNIGYFENEDIFKYSRDTINVKNINSYSSITSTIKQNISISNFDARFNAGYEHIDYNIEGINYNDKMSNYYASVLVDYGIFNNKITPAIFGKYSRYNKQNNTGFGIDLTFKPLENTKFLLGYSNFEKPYSVAESQYLSNSKNQTFKTYFVSLEYFSNNIKSSLSYFNSKATNLAIPVLNNDANQSGINEIIFTSDNRTVSNGINLNSNIEYWNILSTINLNYYWSPEGKFTNSDKVFTLKTGLFFVDTLYNSNLDLKTGFIFYLYENPQYRIYDFQQMRSASYGISGESVTKLNSLPAINDKFRLDFYLAGRIQDAATFYFIYENILANNYYVVPYYPMPEGGIRIGISWDFLD